MPNDRVSLNAFSRRKHALFSDKDLDELFDAQQMKGLQSENINNKGTEDDADSEGDIFDGLTFDETVEDDQAREDTIPEKYDLMKKYRKLKDRRPQRSYQDSREGFLTDDDSTTLESETSTLPSMQSSLPFSGGMYSNSAPFSCPDASGLTQQLTEIGTQLGTIMEETNQALANDLEVGSFVQEIQQLQEHIVKDGFEHMKNIDLVEVIKSMYGSIEGVSNAEQLQLDSQVHEGGPEEKRTDRPKCADDNCMAWMPDVNDLGMEEGMEMPLLGCGLLGDDMHEEEKKKTILTKLFSGPPKLSSPTCKFLPSSKNSSVPALKPEVLRVQLEDGSMATVSKDTATRLEHCRWV